MVNKTSSTIIRATVQAGAMVGFAVCVGCLCGCASGRGKADHAALAKIIAEETEKSKAAAVVKPASGHNAPEAPSPAMPPMSKIGRVTIQPESVVQISVDEDPALDGSYQVNDSSAIEFGYVGLVFLEDMTADEAAAKVEATLKNRGFRSATVTLRITKASYDKVRVSGAVMKPCDLKIGPGSSITLGEALRRAEGLRPQPKGAKIKVVRDGILSPLGIAAEGREYALVGLDGRPQIPDLLVHNNDWIHVYPGDGEVGTALLGEKEILVLGEVEQPGLVRFSGGEPSTMLHLVMKIGGLPKWADPKRIVLIRKKGDGTETETKLDIRKLLQYGNPDDDVSLESGDRIIIQERTLFF
jgi:protein involved in polysaccharide export with SLBB domain